MSGVKWWPEQGPSSDINNGIAVAGWIHSALVVGDASAWVYWWYQPLSTTTNDNEGLILQNGTDTKRRYTLGNYSKFVRPGFVRVDATAPPAGLSGRARGAGSGRTRGHVQRETRWRGRRRHRIRRRQRVRRRR